MSDFSKLLKIVSETTSGAVASVAQPLTTEAQKRDDESSASNIDVVEYGNWENSALVTGDKLKRERKKAAKVVKSIYGEGTDQKRKSILESLQEVSHDEFNIGDPVEITGPVQFKGSTGEVVDVRNGFVVVDLYNHGKRSFHASDVSYNDYADSDEEEAHHYDREKDARDREGMAEGSLNEGQYEMMLRNGQVKKFVAKDDADAKRIAAGHGAKSVIKLRGGVPAGKIAEQGVAEGVAETLPLDDAIKVLKHYGANSFIKSIDNLKFYKNDRPLSIDLIQNDDGTRSVSLSQLNSATRQLKGQGTSEDSAKALVTKWMGLHRRYGGYDDFDVNQMKKRVLSDFDYKEKLEQEIKSAQRKQGVAEDFRKSSQKYDFELDDIMVPYSDDTIEVGVNYTTAEDEDYNGRVEQIVDTVEVHDLATGKEITELLSERTLNWIYSQAYEQLEQAQADERDFAASDRGEQMKRDRDMGYYESKQGVAEAIPYALSAANANAEYNRAKKHLNGFKGRVDVEVTSKNSYLATIKALHNMAKKTNDHIECSWSEPTMSVFSNTMNSEELDEFVDDLLHLRLDREPRYDRYRVAEDEYVDDTYEKPVLLSFELYNIKTNERVYGPFKAYDLFGAAIKADDYLEAKGMNGKSLTVRRVKKQGVAEGQGDVVQIHQHQHGKDMGKYGTFNIERETPTIIVVYDHNTGEMLKFNRATGRGIGPASQLMIKQGVAEGGILKSIKRGMQGWDSDKSPKEIVKRNKEYDDETIKSLSTDARNVTKHSPADLQKRVVDREMKRRGLGEQGVAEDSDPCWDNYKQIGMKTKNGKQVPNCVPKESVEEATTKPAKVEAYGYKYNNRDQRIVWRKIFPSVDAMNKWAEKTNATVIGTREV